MDPCHLGLWSLNLCACFHNCTIKHYQTHLVVVVVL